MGLPGREGIDERTLLFTDIEGSTPKWEQHPNEMLSAITVHNDILEAVISRWCGQIVDNMGDGVFAVFDEPLPAVSAAVDVQIALSGHDFGVLDPFRVRIGIHQGPVTQVGGHLLGPSLNRAARLMGAASGGQVLVTEPVAVRLAGHERFRLANLGAHLLRGLGEAIDIWQVSVPELSADFPPIRSSLGQQNLPAPASTFVGRSQELARLAELIGRNRLVTLTGVGGCGKTRLVTEFALRWLTSYPDGVWFVSLADIDDPADVARSAAAAANIQDEPGRPILQTFLDRFRTSRALIILDNCEHVVTGAAELAMALVERTDHVRVVATSRMRLEVDGSALVRLEPLRVVETSSGTADAIALFVDRALRTGAELRLDDEELAVVTDICRHVDGIPLAIELAANRLSALSLTELRDRLGQRLSLLSSGGRAVARHRTMRAALEWSYELLAPTDRAAMYDLAIFSGGFELDAVSSVLACDEFEALDIVQRLVENSLLSTETQGPVTRYRMLEPMRQLGHEQLQADGRQVEVEARHRAWVLHMAATVMPLHLSDDGPYWHDRLDREFANVRLAMASAFTSAPQDAQRLCADLGLFLWLRGHLSEGRDWCQRALDVDPDDHGGLRGRVLLALGELAFGQLDLGVGVPALAASHERGMAQGDLVTAGWASMFLAVAYAARGEQDVARWHRDFALRVADERESASVRAGSYYYIGSVDSMLGDHASAQFYLRAAVELAREAGAPYTLTRFLPVVARQYLNEGDEEAASQTFKEALELARVTHDNTGIARALVFMAEQRIKKADLETALENLEEALPIVTRQIDDLALACKVNLGLATVYRYQGRYDEAARSLAQGFEAGKRLSGWKSSVDPHLSAAMLAVAVGDTEGSLEQLDLSESAARQANHDERLARSLAFRLRMADWLGETFSEERYAQLEAISRSDPRNELQAAADHARGVHFATRRPLEAVALLERAQSAYDDLGSPLAEIEVSEDLALALVNLGDVDRARELLTRARRARRDLGCPLPPTDGERLRAAYQLVETGGDEHRASTSR